MKIGVISDIHSNIIALEETFKRFETEKVEKVICIGDVIGIGPYPEKCVQFLMDNKHMILSYVKGNHENYLLNGITRRNHNEKGAKPLSDEEMETHIWNHSKIDEQQKDFIKKLKYRDKVVIEGKRIVIEHYPMDENNKFKKFHKNPSAIEIKELFEDKNADIYLFGHTHKIYYCNNNEKYYINPGSLGCPIDTKSANAGILNIENDKVEYKQLQVKYDIENVITDIKKLNYPLNDVMINIFYSTSSTGSTLNHDVK